MINDFYARALGIAAQQRAWAESVRAALESEIAGHQPQWQMEYLRRVDEVYPTMWLSSAFRTAEEYWGLSPQDIASRIGEES